MATSFDQELEERFLRYVAIDTQADEASKTTPSTATQFELLKPLKDELEALEAQDVMLTEYGAVIATIPATTDKDVAPIAFLAHVDTSPQYSGAGVKPVVHRHYQGQEIHFPEEPGLVLTTENSPYLATKLGDDIVTASGSTLLGADDKAGVAIVMTLAKYLLENPTIVHGPIRVCFTPDEEIGRGVHKKLPEDLKAAFGYTLDGSDLGDIVYETFSADKAVVKVHGVSIHPSIAKDKLVNALHLCAKIIDTLPHVTLTPETTSDRQGFMHLYQLNGTAADAEMHFILRSFERDELAAKGALLEQVCATIQATEPRAHITCTITEQYRNMRYWLENDMRPVELARRACDELGIPHFSKPVRGGTDGSRLTEMGVPTPNLFTGMQNIHGPLEYVSIQDMARATEVCLKLAQIWDGTPQE